MYGYFPNENETQNLKNCSLKLFNCSTKLCFIKIFSKTDDFFKMAEYIVIRVITYDNKIIEF